MSQCTNTVPSPVPTVRPTQYQDGIRAPLSTVTSLATVLSVLNVILLTALATVFALLYNLCASLVGGIGVTLTDD